MPHIDSLLLGSLFQLRAPLQAEPGRLRAQLRLDPGHAVFRGHFPGRPVLPGVCVLTAAQEVLQQHLAQPLLLRSCSSVKFLHPIDPLLTPALELTVDFTRQGYFLDFQASVQHEQQPLCRLAGRLQANLL